MTSNATYKQIQIRFCCGILLMFWKLVKYQFEVDCATNHDYTYPEAEAFEVPASPKTNTALVTSSRSCGT